MKHFSMKPSHSKLLHDLLKSNKKVVVAGEPLPKITVLGKAMPKVPQEIFAKSIGAEECEWKPHVARAWLLRCAADFIEDETPFEAEADSLCWAALRQPSMSEQMFRFLVKDILDWDNSGIDMAVAEVKAGKQQGA